MTVDGEAEDVDRSRAQEVTMTVDKTGKVHVHREGDDTDAAAEPLRVGHASSTPPTSTDQFTNVIFPDDGTAKVGEEWTSRLHHPPLRAWTKSSPSPPRPSWSSVATENGRAGGHHRIHHLHAPSISTIDLGALLQAMMGGMAERRVRRTSPSR